MMLQGYSRFRNVGTLTMQNPFTCVSILKIVADADV